MLKKLTSLSLSVLICLAFCLLFSACAPVDQAGMDSVPKPDASGEQHEEPDTEVSSASEVDPVPEDDPVPELSARDRNWITDIHYLQNHYKTYHPDPFYLCPEEEFDRKIDRLCQKVNGLSDNDIFFELSAIIAGMGDTHRFHPRTLFTTTFFHLASHILTAGCICAFTWRDMNNLSHTCYGRS